MLMYVYGNINVSELDRRLHKCIIWCRDAVDNILAGPSSDLSMYYAANVSYFPRIFSLRDIFTFAE